jgi:cytochrome b
MQAPEDVMAVSKIRVWDLPTRVFHWALVCLVSASILTIKLGGNWVEWHFRCGYAILALLLFRITWGFVGPRYARFAQFVVGPRRVFQDIRTFFSAIRSDAPGHHPLGGVAVVILLADLLFQAVSGLFSNDDVASEGPFAVFLSKNTSDEVSGLHSANATFIYILIGLHIGAIGLISWRKGRDLISPMLSGSVPAPVSASPGTEDSVGIGEGWKTWIGALMILAAWGLLVWFLVSRPVPSIGR